MEIRSVSDCFKKNTIKIVVNIIENSEDNNGVLSSCVMINKDVE